MASESGAASPSQRLSRTDELLKTSQFKTICPTQACTKPEPFVFGQSATPGASSGGGGAAGKLDSKKTYAASLLKRASDGGRSETEPMARGEPKFPCRPTNKS